MIIAFATMGSIWTACSETSGSGRGSSRKHAIKAVGRLVASSKANSTSFLSLEDETNKNPSLRFAAKPLPN